MITTMLEGEMLGERFWKDIAPQHQTHILQQLADVTAQLCRCYTFDKIGGLECTVSEIGVVSYDI